MVKVKSKKSEDFFDKLRNRTKEAKEIGSTIRKTTSKEGGKLGKQIAKKGKQGIEKGKKGIDKGKQGFDKGIVSAKKSRISKLQSLELIEKLGAMRESGLLTEREFQEKKKVLLENI